jgi:hypothetical protein
MAKGTPVKKMSIRRPTTWRPVVLVLPAGAIAAMIGVFADVRAAHAPSAEAGKLVAWGLNDRGQTDVPSGSDFVSVAAGSTFCVALRSDGTLVQWGYSTFTGSYPVPSGDDFVRIDAGANHAMALRADGTLVAWGGDILGSVSGVNASTDRFTDMACGGMHSVGLREDTTLVGWGQSLNGQLGFPAASTGWRAVAADFNTTYAIRSDGKIVGWGHWGGVVDGSFVQIDGGNQWFVALRLDGSIMGGGSDYDGVLSDIPEGDGFALVAAGDRFGVAIRSDGALVAWGRSDEGQADVPTGDRFVAITGGRRFGAAIEGPETPNTDPEISGFSPATPLTMDAGTSREFAVDAYDDDDGDALGYAWELDGAPIAGADEASWTYAPGAGDAGGHMLTVTVSDGRGGEATHTWDVTVMGASVPDAPEGEDDEGGCAGGMTYSGCAAAGPEEGHGMLLLLLVAAARRRRRL